MHRSYRKSFRILPFVLALSLLALPGCRREPPPPVHRGPIVLITIDALRADTVESLGGAPRVMPALSGLAREATWAGRAVSPSSWTVPSMAALFTGFQPWRAGNWGNGRAVLDDKLVTLPEALKQLGYRTAGFRSNHWLQAEYGYAQGFDTFRYLREGKRAEGYLADLKDGQEMVWVHILPPHAPYVRRDPLLDRLENAPPDLPKQVRPIDLEPYYDPAVDPSPEEQRVIRAMYHLNAAWADQMLGRLLESLKKSGLWDRTLLVVTSDHGEEMGEYGQIAHGGNLGRKLIEVPLVIKLPAGFDRKLQMAPGSRPATVRVGPTLIEAAGGTPEPGTAPSFFHPYDKGALSELYSGDGVNRFSLVDGDFQLLWESRFALAEPDYYRARFEGLGGTPEPPLKEPAQAVFGRLEQAFAKALPLSGLRGEKPRLTLRRWVGEESEEVTDPERLDRMTRQLKNAWTAANGPEVAPGAATGKQPKLTPQQLEELRQLGYIGGGS